jgi:UDP:flavonoid glycosyltransferase YjiC (YdhE family)
MGRVLFVTWHGGGNVNPVLAIGQQLAQLGHGVHVLGSASLRARVTAAGLGFTPRPAPTEWDAGQLVDDVTDACEAFEPDLVVVDYMLPAALCATEVAGLRTVVIVHTLYGALLKDGTVGPMAMSASLREINELRDDLGLRPVGRLGDLLDRAERVIVTVPASIDLVPSDLPANVTYVGPVFELAGQDAGWTPPIGNGPLIVVSLGTTDMDELPVLTNVLDALAHERARVFATVGDHADPTAIPTHVNATVSRFVQHAAVLPYADLVICHGGIGTSLAAVAHGVPLLFLPLGRDQPVNARAIAATGAAKVLPATATPGQVARAADELLSDPSYREAAGRIAVDVPEPGAVHPATTLIDELVAPISPS